jgi:2-polyprenyl-3-methyl-5-hydroxy-6-metoxy-1,4-benzoquinol methylase|tara:strand:- start:56 stop:880 length:825 start_codon:yes stop_codon:yes gene_type:complete
MPEEITKNYLKKKQYSTTKYLEARIKIHQFTMNKYSFHEWILNNFDMSAFSKDKPIKVLDVGCGTGVFWQKNSKKLNEFNLDVIFTDLTQAMVDKEEKNTKDIKGNKAYEIADVDNLEKYYGKFDIVMCHNVLYHAQDKNNALNNLQKCLNDNPNSFCSITTNSEKHMLNVYETGRNLDKNFPTDRIIDTFTEEIADKLIPNYFEMDKRLEEEELQVTDWEILMGFVASGVEPRGIKLVDNFYEKYKEIFENEMKTKGYFQIIKRSPLYVCKKK